MFYIANIRKRFETSKYSLQKFEKFFNPSLHGQTPLTGKRVSKAKKRVGSVQVWELSQPVKTIWLDSQCETKPRIVLE